MTTTEELALTLSDRIAIEGLAHRVMAAWSVYDADAFASVFTENGSMIIPGAHRRSRAEVREAMAQAFAGPFHDTQIVCRPYEIRPLGPGVALMLSEGGIRPRSLLEVPDASAVRASWVVVKRGSQWLLDAYQNSPRG